MQKQALKTLSEKKLAYDVWQTDRQTDGRIYYS